MQTEDRDQIHDLLRERGINDPKAFELSNLPAITLDIVEDAFRRAKHNTEPIVIASRIRDRADARESSLLREDIARQQARQNAHLRTERREREKKTLIKQCEEEQELMRQIPDSKLTEFVNDVVRMYPWITIQNVMQNRMLRCLVMDRMKELGYEPGTLFEEVEG